MVDSSKVSILKPQQIQTPINIRGTLPGGATTTLPIQPFTIRTASISSIQPRPPTSSISSSINNPVHKVITQQSGTPIQFVNANKNVIQTITPIPKLNTVCLTLSTNANLAPNNSSPIVAVASRAGSTPSLIMTPTSSLTMANATVVNTTTSTLPITKVYPVGRDGGQVSIVDGMFSSASSSTPGSGSSTMNSASAVSVSTVNLSTTSSSNASNPQHVLVHTTTPTINVHAHHPSGLPLSSLAPGSITPATSYYVDKNFQMNLVSSQNRPISLETAKKMIIATTPNSTTANSHYPNTTTVTIPLPQLPQHLNITHLGQPPGNTQQQQHNTTVISTTSATSSQNHHPPHHHQLLAQIPHSMITSSTTLTVTPTSSSLSQNPPLPIPSHMISQQSVGVSSTSSSGASSVLTVTTTTITSSTTTSSSSISNSSSVTQTSSISSTSSSNTTTTTAPPAQSPNHNNPNNNNSNTNTKATHSPRPSILRKRELVDHHHQSHANSSNRAQRNLSLQLNFASSNSTNFTSSSNKENSSLGLDKFSNSLSTTTTAITSSTNIISATSSSTSSSGVSILKKEFQPPTEESSWQSVSSNSSSGSSTISTTSETAELQLQQQLGTGGSSVVGGGDLNLSTTLPLHTELSGSAFVGVGLGLTNSINSSNSGSTGGGKNNSTISILGVGGTGGLSLGLNSSGNNNSNTTNSQNQNGVLRSTQPRSRSSSTSKGVNKDLERLKNKDKDLDAVSPRKKPRKQQLTSSDLLEAASPEIYFQGKGKRFRKGDLMDFSEGITEKEKITVEPIPEEEPPPPRIVYYVKKRNMTLVKTNSILPKPLTTHFQRYCDVKAKEEKRPTVSELANQKNILLKVSGWKLKHMANHMQELVDNEHDVVEKCTALLNRLEAKVGPNCPERDLNTVMELLKGNIQRCKVIRDQMSDSKAQGIKILNHQTTVTEVINKYSSKRPSAKKRVY